MRFILIFLLIISISACKKQTYDVVIRGGTVYDGTGKPGVVTDIAVNSDTIAFIGDLSNAVGKQEVDAKGLAVAPGFINMLSWSTESLLEDGKSQGEIRQGVTLEVMGEGNSMGPLNEAMKQEMIKDMSDIKYNIDWTTLGEYLESLERRGVSTNVASFVGATSVRIHELSYDNRAPNAEELKKMKALVKTAMEEGAMGVGSSLIYAPASYAKTDELIELCKVASEYGGMYITHMRSEGNAIFQAVEETILIAHTADLPAEIYHLKLAGEDNWAKLDSVLAMISKANNAGVRITADMYTYPAGATGLDASMPPWVQEGGYPAWSKRLQDSKTRKKVMKEMETKTDQWENLLLLAGGPDRVLLVGFANDSMKKYTGKTLSEMSMIYNETPEEAAMDLVIRDGSRVGTVYFMINEDNIKKQIALPYMSFGSDAGSMAPEGNFLKSNTHPRAYGNFARLLGKYVRDEKVIPIEEAIRKLTFLPATNLKIKKRGALSAGYFADVVVFDTLKIKDHATFERPHQYSTGMVHVFVNGQQVLKDGEHTGAKPGRVVRGPGWRGKK